MYVINAVILADTKEGMHNAPGIFQFIVKYGNLKSM